MVFIDRNTISALSAIKKTSVFIELGCSGTTESRRSSVETELQFHRNTSD